ncbi:MAG: A24 family peptidase [Planctomycetaceae bacterium]|jgi:prepilin signal peptidase PulO-like enzyme (type II secretory pathway)|nr:A24 family peptidase [Planctomycetaceae bacterium]
MEIKYAILMLVGVIVGAFLNWLTDCWGLFQRFRSPWRRIPKNLLQEALQKYFREQKKSATKKRPPITFAELEKTLRKRWYDYLPLFGWIPFSRFSTVLGSGFWVRPFFVEAFCGAGLAFLYRWEIEWRCVSILILQMNPEQPDVLFSRFLLHAVLFAFLFLATLTDFDDFIIPDLITVPGTVCGLLAAVFFTCGTLPTTEIRTFAHQDNAETTLLSLPSAPAEFMEVPNYDSLYYRRDNVPLHIASPNIYPAALNGRPNAAPLAIALFCWWGWCFAMMNRVWRVNFGLRRAAALFLRRLRRSQSTWYYLLAALIGSLIIAIIWIAVVWKNGSFRWQNGFSALIGMACGGLLIWGVRIVGTIALRREAMGFGDVTFMAMIGAFLGWQPCIFIFFLAPFAGIVLGLSRWLLGLGGSLPYGPFLAMATVATVLFWSNIWLWAEPFFEIGWLVPVLLLFCGIMMFVLLRLIEILRGKFNVV